MKTIMVLIPRMGMGGISKIGAFVANSLLNAGHNVICCSLVKDKATIKLNNDVIKESVKYPLDDLSIGKLTKAAKKINAIRMLYSLIKKYGVDEIIAFGLDLARIALVVSQGKCKVIASERGNPYRYTVKQMSKYCKVLKKADYVVFQTNGAKQAFPASIVEMKSKIIANPAVPRQTIKSQHTRTGRSGTKRILWKIKPR